MNQFNYLDRGIIPGSPDEFGFFIEDTLKVENTSTYIGILSSAFIGSFSISVVVFGHLVHYYRPFKILGWGFGVWLLAVFLSGLSHSLNSFPLLLFARGLSGVGEASLQAIGPIFITDNAPEESKRLWLGIYLSMVVFGTALGYGYSALIATHIGWEYSFWIEGTLMLPLVFLISQQPHQLKGTGHSHPPRWCEEVTAILRSRIFILVTLGSASFTAVTTGLATYGPTFIQGLGYFKSEEAASWSFSGVVAVAGMIGTPMGGLISDHLKIAMPLPLEQRRLVDLAIMFLSAVLGSVALIAACLLDSRMGFIGGVGLGVTFLFSSSTSCTMAVLQSAPPEMKSSAMALMTLAIHLLGDVPMNPLMGLLKDTLAPRCNVVHQDGKAGLNPDCHLDRQGLKITLLITVAWLSWSILFWSIAAGIDLCAPRATFLNQHEPLRQRLGSSSSDEEECIADPPTRGSSLALVRDEEIGDVSFYSVASESNKI